jgi:hypothetical protein
MGGSDVYDYTTHREWLSRAVFPGLTIGGDAMVKLCQVHRAHAQATVIGTNNAEINAPILSINARVGFKIAWRNIDYQVTREALDA